jgi:chemotaxis family two-component system response regulator Rcp1
MRILLVEDLRSDAVLLHEALRDAGLEQDLVLAHDGQEALDLLQGGGALPQLVLLDLNLPKVSGHQVLDEIRADDRLRHLPVVVLTTSLAPADIAFAYRHQANAYVRKPNGFEALSTVAKAIRDFWIRVATLPSPFPKL